jgi:hypothetical protein
MRESEFPMLSKVVDGVVFRLSDAALFLARGAFHILAFSFFRCLSVSVSLSHGVIKKNVLGQCNLFLS